MISTAGPMIGSSASPKRRYGVLLGLSFTAAADYLLFSRGARSELFPDPWHHVGPVAPLPFLFGGGDVPFVARQDGLLGEGGQPPLVFVPEVRYLRHLASLLYGPFPIRATLAPDAALGALPEGHSGAPLFGAVWEDAGLEVAICFLQDSHCSGSCLMEGMVAAAGVGAPEWG